MIVIKIDKNSIKKNPNAGNTSYILPSGPLQRHKEVINTKNYIKIKEDEEWMLVSESEEVSVSHSQPQQVIHSLTPEGKYNFSYEDTKVRCKDCDKEFSYKLLDSSYEYDSFYENICPYCNLPNCCEYRFETIEEALNGTHQNQVC